MKQVVIFFSLIFCANSIFATTLIDIGSNPDSTDTIASDTSKWIYTKTTFLNGNKKDEGYLADGVRQGVWIYYDIQGGISSKMEYKNGILEGTMRFYFLDTIVKQELNFVAGKKEGGAITYYESGSIQSVKTYANDKLNGAFCQYYTNGQLEDKGTYRADSLFGSFIAYYEDGQTKLEGSYLNSKYDGVLIHYHDNGCVAFRKYYKNGSQNDTVKFYYYEGDLASVFKVEEGKIVGTYLHYGDNGNLYLKADVITRADTVIELVLEHDDEGKFYKRVSQITIGKSKVFSSVFANGNTEMEMMFYDNIPTGTWNFYYESGQLERVENYASKEIIQTWTTKNKATYSGQLHGLYQSFYETGKLRDQATLNYGVLNGKKIFCDSVSKMKEVMRFENGIQQGNTDLYDSTGILTVSGFYQNGKLISAVYYYRDGTTQSIMNFHNDIPYGPCRSYYVGGELECTGSMDNGMSGLWTCYHRNGMISETGKYASGNKIGKWKYYDDNGKLQLKEKY